MFCLRCGAPPTHVEDEGYCVTFCQSCGSTSFTDDLPAEPINLWDFEETSWRTDNDTMRLNASEVLAEELQHDAEREAELYLRGRV